MGAFRSHNSSALERLGLVGTDVAVTLEGDQLVLRGRDGGMLSIPAAAVDRLRHFRSEEVHQLPANVPAMAEVKIWWGGRRKPVLLTLSSGKKGYRSAIGGFAERVVAYRGLGRLMLGPGYTTAIVNLLIVVPPCLLLLGVLLLASITNGGWWWPASIALLALFGWLVGRNLVSRWPRRVAGLEAFMSDLP